MPSIGYYPLANTLLTGNQTAITFSGISQSYSHLEIIGRIISAGTSNILVTFNNNTTAVYSNASLYVSGTAGGATGGSSMSNNYFPMLQMTSYDSTYGGFFHLRIPGYTNSTKRKSALGWSGTSLINTTGETNYFVGEWNLTSAITQIDMTASGSQFASGTNLTLYGVL